MKLEEQKLIAKFMGVEYYTDGIGWFDSKYKCLKKYNTDWNALIPVIDKVTSHDKYIEYKEYSSSMVSDGGIYINTKFIENTYLEVVDFIKWFNSTTL